MTETKPLPQFIRNRKRSTNLDKVIPFYYLPISSVDLVHNFRNNNLFIHSIFQLFVLGVLADFQISPLEGLPHAGQKKDQGNMS